MSLISAHIISADKDASLLHKMMPFVLSYQS